MSLRRNVTENIVLGPEKLEGCNFHTCELTLQLLVVCFYCVPKTPDSKQIVDSSQLFVELFLLLQLQMLL